MTARKAVKKWQWKTNITDIMENTVKAVTITAVTAAVEATEERVCIMKEIAVAADIITAGWSTAECRTPAATAPVTSPA